jgi:hypothetical protein
MLGKLASCLSVSFVESTLAVWTHRAARNPGQGYPRPHSAGFVHAQWRPRWKGRWFGQLDNSDSAAARCVSLSALSQT